MDNSTIVIRGAREHNLRNVNLELPRNRLIVLLSVKAGLRAAEIAKLSWDMVLGPSGEVGVAIELQDKIAKKRGGRSSMN